MRWAYLSARVDVSTGEIFAEALLQKIGKGKFNGYSAGSDPAAEPMPEVIERLRVLCRLPRSTRWPSRPAST
jgi:hypothetical protein